jgi:SAM-dependent methyltransferase
MERDYAALLDDGEQLAEGFENDYRDIAELLRGYRGRVLDIGGGNGVARHWLTPEAEYVLLESSLMWEDPRWRRFHTRFPSLAVPCARIRGFGERLPFRDRTFDHALCLWTLNHVASIEKTLAEAVRVVRAGGRILLVLEESEPTWLDLVARRYPHARTTADSLRAMRAKLLAAVRGWPLQPDHVHVRERTVRRTRGARVVRREWRGLYLTFELERLSYLNT